MPAVEEAMASISVGGAKSGKRSYDQTLPLVPFIDFMVCLIAFLIVTAVWTQASRINATGKVPGDLLGISPQPQKELHVLASAGGFELRWQQGATVLETQHVPRIEVMVGSEPRFPALSDAITKEWLAQGVHRAVSDQQLDRAVLHVPNDLPFSEMVALLDALQAPRRGKTSAFDVALASN
jgi:biopolymer transport protein ExbD